MDVVLLTGTMCAGSGELCGGVDTLFISADPLPLPPPFGFYSSCKMKEDIERDCIYLPTIPLFA